jgi:hypothetical protein
VQDGFMEKIKQLHYKMQVSPITENGLRNQRFEKNRMPLERNKI